MTDQPTDPNEGIQIPKKVEEEIEKKRQHAILVEQIKKELKTNPRYKNSSINIIRTASIHLLPNMHGRRRIISSTGKTISGTRRTICSGSRMRGQRSL
jgi:hypothetical protein